ncbi:peptidase E [Bacillus sp. JCM 19045]|nr:peptidase E [Bacillus sp. JCM 19045]
MDTMKQIIALGGGGFSMEPDNLLLDQYIVNQAKKDRPKICFIPTASGDSETYIQRFYNAFNQLDCVPSHLSLFKPPTRDLASFVLEKEIIYVGGGNTKNLMILWKEWGLDHLLKQAWENGIILSGLSAGSICWFEEGASDSYGDRLERIGGLGILAGSHCPHYDGEELRRPSYLKMIKEKELTAGIAVDDGAALHYVDQELVTCVSSRKQAGAYNVYLEGNESVEEKIATNYLGQT